MHSLQFLNEAFLNTNKYHVYNITATKIFQRFSYVFEHSVLVPCFLKDIEEYVFI